AGLASVQPKASDHGVASDSLAGPQALVESDGANQTWPRVLGRARVQSLSGSALSLLESLSAWRRAHRDRVEVLSPWYELERPLWRRLRRGPAFARLGASGTEAMHVAHAVVHARLHQHSGSAARRLFRATQETCEALIYLGMTRNSSSECPFETIVSDVGSSVLGLGPVWSVPGLGRLASSTEVAKVFPEFEQHSGAAVENKELIQAAIEAARCIAAEKQAAFGPQIESAKLVASQHQAAFDALVQAERQASADAEAKAEVVKASQEEVDNVKVEHSQVEASGRAAAECLEKLRAEQSAGTAISEGSLRMLMEGGWEDEELMQAAVDAVTEHLTNIHAEKALVAAVAGGLAVKPAARGLFDQITLESLTEVLAARALELQQKIT
ncbi:unnamed protein product, partial [Polarella glacialis]